MASAKAHEDSHVMGGCRGQISEETDGWLCWTSVFQYALNRLCDSFKCWSFFPHLDFDSFQCINSLITSFISPSLSIPQVCKADLLMKRWSILKKTLMTWSRAIFSDLTKLPQTIILVEHRWWVLVSLYLVSATIIKKNKNDNKLFINCPHFATPLD